MEPNNHAVRELLRAGENQINSLPVDQDTKDPVSRRLRPQIGFVRDQLQMYGD